MKRSLALLALMLVVAAAPAPHKNVRPIGIVINGDALAIDPPPRFEKNILYVPVRRTIEALGLTFNRTGNHIQTQIGSKTAVMTVGKRIVQLDAGDVAMAGPPLEIHDVLYVPLRFFTDVLGAQAHFDRRSNMVNIVAQLVGRTTNGFETVGNGYARFGTVSGVDVLSDPPTLTIESNGVVKTIRIGENATVEVHDVNVDVTSPGELGDVRPGDFARVEMRKDGRVQRVIDEYGSRNGRIVAMAGRQFVLGDGQVISVGRTTEVSLNGKAAQFDDLRPGDEVSIRYNVETNEVREVLAGRRVASGGEQVAIDSVDSDARRPLRPGNVLHVTMRGTPNGSASFDIGSDVVDQAMAQRSPGFYAGSYTIPRGANFRDVVLIGRLNAGGAVAQQAAADAISASSTPPGIADFAPDENATINTNRPAVYASFASDAVAVNPASALLWIDGRDVTSECVRTNAFIQYLPSYAYRDGPVHVTVRVSDDAGKHHDEVVDVHDSVALMENCVFCKIADGQIPATVIERNEGVIAISDLNPQAPSHVLVLPVDHHATIAELTENDPATAGRLLATAAAIGRRTGGDRGFRLVINSGEDAGQTVDHVHVHVLAGRSMSWPPG